MPGFQFQVLILSFRVISWIAFQFHKNNPRNTGNDTTTGLAKNLSSETLTQILFDSSKLIICGSRVCLENESAISGKNFCREDGSSFV